jgi:hypothetical protein
MHEKIMHILGFIYLAIEGLLTLIDIHIATAYNGVKDQDKTNYR